MLQVKTALLDPFWGMLSVAIIDRASPESAFELLDPDPI
jgi:hypothetical protein